MSTSHRFFVLACAGVLSACESTSPPTPTPASPPTRAGVPAASAGPAAEPPAPAASATPTPGCLPPVESTGACAAVMVYVRVKTHATTSTGERGALVSQCCAYANPCVAPEGPKFSDASCSSPMP